MPQAAHRLQQLLVTLNQGPRTHWEELNRLWIDSLLEFDGMPEEHVLDRLGGPLRRRDRDALALDIERTLQFLTLRADDPAITVVWQ